MIVAPIIFRIDVPISAMIRTNTPLLFALLVGGAFLAGCTTDSAAPGMATAPTDTIAPETKADSVAYRLVQAHGADALATAPYLRFNFGNDTPNGTNVVARHFWDRTTGDYRVEWSSGPDSSYVALIYVREVQDDLPTGTAYLNGEELTGSAGEEARRQAYGRFINDTYWLLAPLKTFDPGVNRTYLPDSSTAEHDVLHLTFGDVGLTPNDEYWLSVSKETGRLDRWAFHLQGMSDDDPPQAFTWTNYRSIQAPGGTVQLAARKEVVGSPGAVLTNQLALPSEAPDGVFSNPEPILAAEE